MSVGAQSRARQFHIRLVVVPISLVPAGIVAILIVVLLVVLVVPIALPAMLALLALLVLLTLWVVITIVVVAWSLARLTWALALTLGHSRHVGQVSEKAMVSDWFSVPNLDEAEWTLRSIPTDEVWHRMPGQNSPDHQVMGTLDRNLAVKVAEKKDAILLQNKIEMLAQPSTNDESNGENEGRSRWVARGSCFSCICRVWTLDC